MLPSAFASLTNRGCVERLRDEYPVARFYHRLTTFAGLAGCAASPADGEEQVQTIDELVERTLSDLYSRSRRRGRRLANPSATQSGQQDHEIPLVGAGTGIRRGINTKTGEKTYIRMSRFDVGGGWAREALRPGGVFQ